MKLLIIDGLNVIRPIYEMRSGDNRVAESINSARFTMRNLVRTHNPTHVLFAFDEPGELWRHRIYPKYKATREPAPEAFYHGVHEYRKELACTGWAVFCKRTQEADDLIASAASKAVAQGVEVIVATNDKDSCWLIDLGVQIYSPFDTILRDSAWVLKKFGVRPAQMLDYLALVGDTGDNIPGVPGVGSITAAKLLTAHQDLPGVLASASMGLIKGKAGRSLVENAALALLSRDLVSPDLDAIEGELDFDTLRRGGELL